MAKEIVFVINADTTQSVKSIDDLESAIESLKSELKKTDLGTEEFKRLSGQLQNAQSEVKALEKTFEGLEPEKKVEAFAKVGEAVAGGFAAATGAMALFGEESETVNKLAEKSQQAIVIAMGLRAIAEGSVQASIAKRIVTEYAQTAATKASVVAQGAYNLVVGVGTNAMKLFRIAVAATGIGALVVGLILLWQNFDKVSKFVNGVIDKFESLRAIVDFLTVAWNSFAEAVGLAETAEEKQLAQAQKNLDVSKLRTAQLQREIDLLKAQGATEEEVYAKQVELYRNRIHAETELYNAKLKTGEATQEEREALRDLGNEYAVFLATRQKQLADEREKEIKAQQDKNKALREEQKKYLEGIGKELQDVRIRNINDAVEREIKAEQLALQRKFASIRGNSEAENELRLQLQIESDAKIKAIKDKAALDASEKEKEIQAERIEAQYRNDLALVESQIITAKAGSDQLLEAQIKQAQLERDQALLDENLTAGEKVLIQEQYNQKVNELNQAQADFEIQLAQAKRDAVISSAQSALSGLTALANAANATGQKQSAAQKALAVASLAVNTAVSIGSTIAGATAAAAAGGPAAPFLLVGYIASGLATVLTAFSSAKKLLGGGGASVSAGAGASAGSGVSGPTPINTSTTPQQDINRSDSSINVKAYVVESEMTDAQKAAEKTKQLSTI